LYSVATAAAEIARRGIGKTYGTAIALIILQLPYKYLPVYQR